MCVKIPTFFLILAQLMMIQKEILSQFVRREHFTGAYEMKNAIKKDIPVFIGRHATLQCGGSHFYDPSKCNEHIQDCKSGPSRFTWLKNNQPIVESEDMYSFNFGRELELVIKSDSTGNYTCKCKNHPCESHTFPLVAYAKDDWRYVNGENMYYLLEQDMATNDRIGGFLGMLGGEYENPLHFERQDFHTDFQKIFVKNVDKKKTLVLTCIDENYPYGDNYVWMKTDKWGRLQNQGGGGVLRVILTSPEQGGNYSCVCKDTSCNPYKHTYQVVASVSIRQDSNHPVQNRPQVTDSWLWNFITRFNDKN